MSRRKATVTLIVLALAGFVGLLVSPGESSAPVPPGITLTGREPRHPYYEESVNGRAAAFAITNRGDSAIYVGQAKVQVLSNGVWRTVFDGMPNRIPVDMRTSLTNRSSPRLEAGEGNLFMVPWPDQGTWRARFSYGREFKGVKLLFMRIRMTWRSYDLSVWRSGRQIFGDFQEIISDEILEDHEKRAVGVPR